MNLFKLKDYIKAIGLFTRAINLNPNEVSYFWHRAEAYLSICDFESCLLNLSQFRSLIHSNHETNLAFHGYVARHRMASVSYTWGQILLDQKRFTQAEKYFNLALELGHDTETIILRIAIAKIGQGDFELALEYLYQVINNRCQDIDVYLLRAKILYLQQNIFFAIADIRSAMNIEPSHPDIKSLMLGVMKYAVQFKNKANEQIIRKDYDLAIWYLNQAIELDPEDWKTLFSRCAGTDQGCNFRRIRQVPSWH